jgi:predicted RNA binding protein YcfA (HicA-like mRNA interferase family)
MPIKDISGSDLIKKLAKLGYIVTRKKGSHIRLTKQSIVGDHHITIPNHNPIKIGLLIKISNDIANNMEISREELMDLIDI